MDIFLEKRILTVTQLTALIRGVLEENFDHVWVQGEVSNLATPSSGHLYFTLKDSGAQVRCVIFRSTARNLRFRLQDGMGLIVRGRISVFDQRGEYQLLGDIVEPQGVGALQLAFMQLKERLAKEGLFDEKKKKTLPPLPQTVGIVTSPTGAAIHDILQVINRRFANLQILLRPVKVQGEGAAEEIAGAIRDFNVYGKIDVMIVGRGGGSLEDLWAFNEEVVARAIAASKIPVISAVGHEIDFSIADLVADVRAPTPSAAAEMVVRSKSELQANVASLSHRLVKAMENSLLRRRGEVRGLTRLLKDPSLLLGQLHQGLDDLSERLHLSMRIRVARHNEFIVAMRRQLRLVNPAVQVERRRERLQALFSRMELAMRAAVDAAHEDMRVAGASLQALSPLATLGRGYTITRRLTGRKVVRRAAELRPGDRVEVVFTDGRALCSVEATEE